MNDEVAIQVQRNKVLIEEEQVELSLVDENVDVEHFFAMMHAWLLVQEVVALNQCLSICASTVLMRYTNLHLWLVTIA